MKLYMSDSYRVEVRYPLDDVQQDILYYLYQPIIGSLALQLYMMLHIEGKRMSRFLQPSSFARLTSLLSMSLLDIEKGFLSLEAIGLLKTFVKHQDRMTFYVYQLQSPLSLKAFFKNQILASLLEESLSGEDLHRTLQYFEITKESLNDYEEITSSFQDVFALKYQKHGKRIRLNVELKEQLHSDIPVQYDIDLLNKYLMDYQVNRRRLTKQDYTFIIQLALVYSLDAFTLAGMIKDSMKSDELDKELLKINIKKYFEIDNASRLKEVYHKQPLQYTTHETDQSPLTLHMKYLDKMTPSELLREKQGGKEPILHDLQIVETLMVQLGLQPAVVNVLLEYVLGKNNNTLSKNYCETIGASLARKNIQTAMEAYNELMNNGEKQEKQEEQFVESVSKKEYNENQEEELMDLLLQFKEGQL